MRIISLNTNDIIELNMTSIVVDNRKVIASGRRGKAIVLPKQWADRNKVKTGDSIVVMFDHYIVVVPPGSVLEERFEVERALEQLEKKGEEIRRRKCGCGIDIEKQPWKEEDKSISQGNIKEELDGNSKDKRSSRDWFR